MIPSKNALLVTALLLAAASTTAAQHAARIPHSSRGSVRALGLVGNGTRRRVVVFDANTDTVLGSVQLSRGNPTCFGDSVMTADLRRGYVSVIPGQIWVIDLTTSPPSLATGLNPLLIPNAGADIALTSDERFLVVCAGQAPLPLAVVEVATGELVSTFSIDAHCVAVDVGPDGSVLVASDTFDRVRRLSIDSTGQLTNTGEFLAQANPVNLYDLPGGAIGLVVGNPGQVSSFMIPGLAPIDTLTTLGSDLGMCALPDPRKKRIYVLKEQSLQAFPFDAVTGTFGAVAVWNVTAGPNTACYGMEQLGSHPDGSKLYVTVPRGVQIRDPESGALIGTITDPNFDTPSGLDVQGARAEIPAFMDVKPGACPNAFNPNGHGVLPVAIVGTDDLDVTRVDIATLRLARTDRVGGSVAPYEGAPGPHTVVTDVSTPFEGDSCGCHRYGGDGIPDLESNFRSDELLSVLALAAFLPGAQVELELTGRLRDGTPFSARDCVRIAPPGTPPGALTIRAPHDGWVQITPLDQQLDGGGFGHFERTYPLGQHVTLTALEIEGLTFYAWEVDGVFQKIGQRTLEQHVRDERSVLRAAYDPERPR